MLITAGAGLRAQANKPTSCSSSYIKKTIRTQHGRNHRRRYAVYTFIIIIFLFPIIICER